MAKHRKREGVGASESEVVVVDSSEPPAAVALSPFVTPATAVLASVVTSVLPVPQTDSGERHFVMQNMPE